MAKADPTHILHTDRHNAEEVYNDDTHNAPVEYLLPSLQGTNLKYYIHNIGEQESFKKGFIHPAFPQFI